MRQLHIGKHSRHYERVRICDRNRKLKLPSQEPDPSALNFLPKFVFSGDVFATKQNWPPPERKKGLPNKGRVATLCGVRTVFSELVLSSPHKSSPPCSVIQNAKAYIRNQPHSPSSKPLFSPSLDHRQSPNEPLHDKPTTKEIRKNGPPSRPLLPLLQE